MDSPQRTFFDLDELRQIASEIRGASELRDLRGQFDRLKTLRGEYADDFDALLSISELQNEAVERARLLRTEKSAASFDERVTGPAAHRRSDAVEREDADAAEISPDVQRLDPKSWQRAIYIGLFFAVILFAAFFYLIQTARRLNLAEPVVSAQTTSTGNAAKNAPAQTSAAVQSAARSGRFLPRG